MASRTAVIAGATGLVGGHLLQQLLVDEAYERVVVLVRKPLGQTHTKLEVREVDFDRLAEQARDLGVRDAFCALGTTIKTAGSEEAFRKVDFTYVHELAKAVRPGADQFLLVSALGASPTSRVFYNRTKGEIEEAVKALEFPGTHFFRPSYLVGERTERRIAEKVGTAFAHVAGLAMKRIRPIEARVVAAAMIRTAKTGLGGVHVYESDRIQEIYDKTIKAGR